MEICPVFFYVINLCVRIGKYKNKPINFVSCPTFNLHSAGFQNWVIFTNYSDCGTVLGIGTDCEKLNTHS